MQRALVTGATGFVGGHLVQALAAAGVEANPLAVDIRAADALSKVLSELRPDVIFHLAAAPRSASLEGQIDVDVRGTEALLSAVEAASPTSRVVVAGSAAEYGAAPPDELPITENALLRPVNPYGRAKAEQSRVALERAGRVDVMVARAFNITGPGEPETLACSAFARQIVEVELGHASSVVVGNLNGARDFVDVRDVAAGYLALCAQGRTGTVYNICSGSSTRLSDVLGQLVSASTVEPPVESRATTTSGDVDEQRGDSSRIRTETGWEASVPLEQSLRDCSAGGASGSQVDSRANALRRVECRRRRSSGRS
jgi:GDP-4-dehydro-6-deoxy-D-mannose reductase